MVKYNQRQAVTMGVSLLVVAIVASACDQAGGDPFEAGQLFRQQVDLALEDAGRFIAGFCSAAFLPALLATAAAWLGFRRDGG